MVYKFIKKRSFFINTTYVLHLKTKKARWKMGKKEEIIQAAVSFFAEKGYFSTSMQEIAKDCGVSKGTLYNLFESKEDLLIQVFEYSHEKMLENIKVVDFETSLSPKEKLIKKIVLQFEIVIENKNFITMLLRTFNPASSSQITTLVSKIHVTMTTWHKNAILEAFGSKAEPYIWDYSLILQGIIKEYIGLTIQDGISVDSQEAARFIVERLESMIDHTKGVKPVLTSQNMGEYEAFEKDSKLRTPKEQISRYLDDMAREMKRVSLPRQVRQETLSAIEYLRKELNEQEPKEFMVKSLLLYLGEIEECELFVKRIQIILEADSFIF